MVYRFYRIHLTFKVHFQDKDVVFFRHLSNTLVCIPQVQHRVGSCSRTGVRSSVKPVKRIFAEWQKPVWCRRKQKSRKCLWTSLSWRKCRLFQVYKGSNNTMWQVFNHAESKEFQRLHSPHLWCQKPPLVRSCTCKCCAEFCCGSRWNSWGNNGRLGREMSKKPSDLVIWLRLKNGSYLRSCWEMRGDKHKN